VLSACRRAQVSQVGKSTAALVDFSHAPMLAWGDQQVAVDSPKPLPLSSLNQYSFIQESTVVQTGSGSGLFTSPRLQAYYSADVVWILKD